MHRKWVEFQFRVNYSFDLKTNSFARRVKKIGRGESGVGEGSGTLLCSSFIFPDRDSDMLTKQDTSGSLIHLSALSGSQK